MVKEVTVSRYIDKFGTLHDTLADAERYEAYCDLVACLQAGSVYGQMDIDDIPRWLDHNAAVVQRYLAKAPKS